MVVYDKTSPVENEHVYFQAILVITLIFVVAF